MEPAIVKTIGELFTQGSGIEIIREVAIEYLQSNENSLELIENLFESIEPIEDTTIKCSLYDLVIDYSRLNGIMPYIAKGMYQKYLIERNDFSRLKETYYSGKYVLNYVSFLPHEEQIELFYKLGVHAYNLRLYHDSIEHCKRIFAEDAGSSPYRVYALWVLRDAYFALGKYEESALYSLQYKQFNYPSTQDHVVLMEALFNAKKGNIALATEQLLTFLKTCSDFFVFPATKHLLELYLLQKNFEGAKTVIESSKVNSSMLDEGNPSTYSEYADYLQLQGEYYLAIGDFDNFIRVLIDGALNYSKINDTIKEKECLDMIIRNHLVQKIPMRESTLEKLSNYYTQGI
ncbi:transcriptional regulator [Paenibacillus sp.]|jgi:tetratricopeptide (TPR) repeat protein|uniref:tetratricopeptide repeat protein n=1 Tax=Paenibacillus sp. TaxID=58172 RepID=UPI00282B264A|nr:transcriptional regulator [Paenibacillus sp.]MDR0268153.1 transcriptional regulator [Paenibacillus sp.]